jgi:hypothetical protein
LWLCTKLYGVVTSYLRQDQQKKELCFLDTWNPGIYEVRVNEEKLLVGDQLSAAETLAVELQVLSAVSMKDSAHWM